MLRTKHILSPPFLSFAGMGVVLVIVLLLSTKLGDSRPGKR